MPKQDPKDISQAANTPLSELMHGIMNYGFDGNIISGGMLVNSVPDVYAENMTPLATIGSKVRMKDGREFMYCKNGAAEIGVAKMAQAEAPTSNWVDETQTAHGWTAGDTSNTCLITTGAAPNINEWAEGWMTVTNGTGLGHMYQIQTNTSHATIVTVSIHRESGVIVDIPAASQLSFLKSNFMDTIVVEKTAGLTAHAIGVPLLTVTIAYYYWSQIKGPTPMFVDTSDSVSVGFPVTHPATAAVDGTIGPCVTLENRYGDVMYVAAGDKVAIVNLDLGF